MVFSTVIMLSGLVGLVGFVVSLVLFFATKIPSVLSDLSGSSKKRQIKELKELNLNASSAIMNANTDNVFTSMAGGNAINPELLNIIKQKSSGDSKSQPLTFSEEVTGYMSKEASIELLGDVANLCSKKSELRFKQEISSL